MGLGHVPTRPVPAAREGAHLSRRERRGAGAARDLDLTDRATLGEVGERVATWFLTDHGLDVIARNVAVGRGELDVLALDGVKRVVAEIRTITASGDPIDAVGPAKRRRVRRLAAQVGADRVDFIGVRLGSGDILVHWVPGCG